MINSTHHLQFDGIVVNQESLHTAFDWNSNSRYVRWVVKPLAVLTAGGFITLGLLAGAFMLMLALATLPLLALAGWIVHRKLEESAQPDQVFTQSPTEP